MMRKLAIPIFLSFLLNTNAFSDELNIDKMLLDIEKKTDLSSKTKLENSGVSIIYTRDDIDRMQARTLKDILKSIFPYDYEENRFGIADPLTFSTIHPFNSSIFRTFIDNQEITTSLYGSGLFILGDIDIGFVDHIEVYTQSPTYEFTSEPTFTLIKLYSKKAIKDSGSKISLSRTNFGASQVTLENSDEMDNFSYFAYVSNNDVKREKYQSHNKDISRDRDVKHLFASIYDDKQNFMFEAIQQDRDGFIDYSLDATPEETKETIDSYHIGYDLELDNFSFLLTYDYLHTISHFVDDVTPSSYTFASIDSDTVSDVISTEVKYKYITNNNKLILGVKYRYKHFNYKKLNLNGIDLPLSGNTNQRVGSLFVENQYSIAKNSIFNFGIETSQVRNNNSIQQDDLFMYRFGYTFTDENLVVKTIFNHMETSLDPFLVNSYGYYITEGKKKPQKADSVFQNIIYSTKNSKYDFLYGIMIIKNYLIPDEETGLLYNQDDNVIVYSSRLRWTYKYNDYDSLLFSLGYTKTTDIDVLDDVNKYSAIIRNINTYKKFDIFNEIIYTRDDNYFDDNYFDYSAGVKYHYTKDLTISIKGENILNKAKATTFNRINPDTFELEEPLKIPSIDRMFTISLEYIF
ncbi:MAG: TonB-dependent receptor [Campylobacterales bacterium]